MTRDSGAVASLKKFYKNKLLVLDANEILKELTGTSDRAVVITMGAFLDDALEYCLANVMRKLEKTEHEYAFRFDGPLGSFSARIEMCYLLKLIEIDRRNQLHDIREMRNACAHSKRPISFKNSELANVAKRVLKKSIFRDTAPSLGAAFISECIFLYTILVFSEVEGMKMLKSSLTKFLETTPSKDVKALLDKLP